MIEADKKRELIIEGAIKRFIHFGFSKTTMNDIADDLSVSKPSLYYYFPDKKNLIAGVIEKIFLDYFIMLNDKINLEDNIEDILNQIIDIKELFFRKYYMLRITEGIPDLILADDNLKATLNNLKIKEQNYYMDVFNNAQIKKEIYHDDVPHIAQLYLESLLGFTTTCIMNTKRDLFPEESLIQQINKNQKELSRIFIKGLRTNNK